MDEVEALFLFLLLLLLGGFSAAALITAIVAQRRCDALRRQIDQLWRRLHEADRPGMTPPPVEPARRPAPPTAAPPRPAAPPTSPTPPIAAAIPAEASGKPVKSAAGLEEKLGARVFVWIGGIALLLAGLFLVKYSAERGLMSEPVRVALGTLFGLVMVAGGQWMHGRSARIAAALCGAGVSVLFGCLMAAVTLYGLIGPVLGFALMAVLTGGAVALSLRHGLFVALLALVGGFVTPAVIGRGIPPAGPTLAFLLLVETAMTVVTRRRRWVSIGALMLAGTMVWALLFAWYGFDGSSRLWVAGFVLGSVAVYVLGAAGTGGGVVGPVKLAISASLSGIAVMGLLVVMGDFSALELGMLALLGAGAMVLGRLDGRYLALPWVAGAAGGGLLWAAMSRSATPGGYTWVVAGYGALFALGGYACVWRNPKGVTWASLSAAAGVGYLLVARWGLGEDVAWWVCAAAGCAAYVVMTLPMLRADRGSAGPLTLGAAAMAAMAVGWGLEMPWRGAGWMGLALVAAVLMEQVRLGALRIAVAVLAGLGCAVLIVPGPFAGEIGDRVVFNVLLGQYGLATIGAAAAAWRMRKAGETGAASGLESVAAGLGMAMVSLLIRHGFHREIESSAIGLMEWATYATAWMIGGLALRWIGVRWGQRTVERAGLVVGVMGLIAAVPGAGLHRNPLWSGGPVGARLVVNGLLYAYGVTALLAGIGAAVWRRERAVAAMHAAGALALLFALISLQVRQVFHGSLLRGGPVSNAEMYSYSLAWVVYGAMLLVLGIARRSAALRYASAVVMLLSVGKVFAFDMAHLRDLYRVLSFFGLGMSLLALGYLYQRFVFAGRRD